MSIICENLITNADRTEVLEYDYGRIHLFVVSFSIIRKSPTDAAEDDILTKSIILNAILNIHWQFIHFSSLKSQFFRVEIRRICEQESRKKDSSMMVVLMKTFNVKL